jgi:hypothetical protein
MVREYRTARDLTQSLELHALYSLASELNLGSFGVIRWTGSGAGRAIHGTFEI